MQTRQRRCFNTERDEVAKDERGWSGQGKGGKGDPLLAASLCLRNICDK